MPTRSCSPNYDIYVGPTIKSMLQFDVFLPSTNSEILVETLTTVVDLTKISEFIYELCQLDLVHLIMIFMLDQQ